MILWAEDRGDPPILVITFRAIRNGAVILAVLCLLWLWTVIAICAFSP